MTTLKQLSKLLSESTSTKNVDVIETVFGNRSLCEAAFDSPAQVQLHRNKCNEFNNYTPSDKTAIHNYTKSSIELNSHLHNVATGKSTYSPEDERVLGKKNIEARKKAFNEHSNALSAAINRHKASKSLTLYTGVKKSPENSDNLVHPSFLSTSSDKSVAERFARKDSKSKFAKFEKGEEIANPKHIIKLTVPKGHPIAYAAQHSDMPEEREHILDKNTRLTKVKEPEYNPETNIVTHHYKVQK